MVKIALAEDNSFLANSLINKLGLFDEFKVKFHALNGEDLLSKLESDSNVDVILMDIQMPVMDGIEATQEVSKRFPHIKTIMLTVLDSEQHIYSAIQAGAIGYLIKESSPQDLFDSVHEILNGGAPLSPSIARKALRIIQNPQNINLPQENFDLSKRELEVLKQLCKGLNYNQISSNLIISPFTVRRHIENIYKKMEVHNKSEALQKAYEHRLV
jgi:DNA-binding NarL/FixJ family response regulator